MQYTVKQFLEYIEPIHNNVILLNNNYKFILIKRYKLNNLNYIFKCKSHQKLDNNYIYINLIHRKLLKIIPKQQIEIEEYIPTINEERNYISIKISFIGLSSNIDYESRNIIRDELIKIIHDTIYEHVLQYRANFILLINNVKYLMEIVSIDINEYYNRGNVIIDNIEVIDNCLLINDNNNNILKNLNPIDIGIGGLDKEFKIIFRRALISRNYNSDIIEKLGIKHIKGIMLYGPPGCGKTLIAKKISKNLKCKEPKIVNGPQILDKYVGESEKKLRELFKDAEEDYYKYKEKSQLHIIIFDEIDAICMERGESSNSHKDGIITQLLTIMDGLSEYNNLLIIGMTNRIDLIDKALLRSGRFELHVEVSLPDEEGRLEILSIHTNTMKINNYLSQDVDLRYLSKITKNYTGAELEGLVKNATSYSLSREYENKDNKILVTKNDFITAYKEIKPLFGSNLGNKLIELRKDEESIVEKIISELDNTVIAINNKDNIIAEIVGHKSDISYITKINNYNFIGYSEYRKAEKLKNIFEDSYKCDKSIIIFENIEQILEYYKIQDMIKVSGIILNTLITLIKMKRTNIILTGEKDTFRELNLLKYINYCYL